MIKGEEMGRSCSMNGKKLNACRVFAGKLERERDHWEALTRWEDNI
jgi:hypothetical protein